MMGDLISVIVPVYNIAEYLPRCIGSILNQTYTNIEVIAVDDGSRDDSLCVLQELSTKDCRLHVIHQENGGVTKARFTGIQVATGDWIGFVDGDDEIEPDMYERLLKNAKQYCADISHCGYQMVFPSHVDYYYNTGRFVRQDKQAGLKDLLAGSGIEPGLWNKLYNKSLLQCLFLSGKMDYSIKINEDLLMNFYLFNSATSSVFEDFCPYHYVLRKGSAATSKIDEHKLADPLKVMNIIRNEVIDNPELLREVTSRIAGILISLATRQRGENETLIAPYRATARKQLRQMVPELIKGKYSLRTKILSGWAAIWPWSYQNIHMLYQNIRGTDKKYKVQ